MVKNLLIIVILTGMISCKKKKEEDKTTPPPPPPSRANTMTAKINGSAWAVLGNSTSTANIETGIADGPPKQYVFIGNATSAMYKNSIWVWTSYATGTVNLRSTPGCSALYFDAAGGPAYYIDAGTMTITAMDTSHVKSEKCDKFKATFSFTTETVGGKSYVIDQGSIDFEAQ